MLKKDLISLNKLENTRLDIKNNLDLVCDYNTLAESCRLLIQAIERFGTPQFSRHARCAFIAKSLCKSLVEKKYITSEQYNVFFSTVRTVAVEYDFDYKDVLYGKMSQEQFLSKYGHLRSGTYNINSPRYDQVKDLFSTNRVEKQIRESDNSKYCSIDIVIEDALEKALADYNISAIKAKEIAWFIKEATRQREYFKFVFTKSLSFAIEIIKKIGENVSIEPKKLSYLELPEIYAAEYYSSATKLKEFWELIINRRQEIFHINTNIILPSLIKDKADFDVIELMESRANFITEKCVTGEVCFLNEDSKNVDIFNKIIVIEKADPGFDWVFSKGISGLITKYGGAASHMAIRCAEFNVAAAIGCGLKLFEYASNSIIITIDCKHEKILRVE